MRTQFIFFFILAFSLNAQNRVDSILIQLNNPQCTNILVVAHRGDWRNFPENSMAAIESAVKMGVDIVELDVQRTKDGHLILMHDKTLDRTTTGKGNVSEWTLDSIKTIKLKNGCAIRTKHDVPTLEEVLLYSKGKILINLDKADRFFDEVFVLLEKTGTTRQIIMKGSKSPEEVKVHYGDYLNDVIYMPVVNLNSPDAMNIINNFQKEMKPIVYEVIFKDETNDVNSIIQSMKQKGSLLFVNSLWPELCGGHDDDVAVESNQPETSWGWLVRQGVDIIQTDRPTQLIKYLRTRGLHQ